jgi:putative phage-type endonuclease
MEHINEIIYGVCQNYESIDTITNFDDLIQYISGWISLKYPAIKHNKDFISTIVKNYVKPIYIVDNYYTCNIPNFFTCEERDNYFDYYMHNIQVPDEYKKIWDRYNYLANIPQPVQRSLEWFSMRNDMITASSGACVLGENKYEKPDKVLLDKIGHGEKFGENKFVHHGKKYEKIATMIYEHIYNVKVGEFGLIPHQASETMPSISFLGASPDGICTNSTLDGKFSNMVGTMLEIKCPLSREIQTKGTEDGEICPHYYWVQVQLQLECCDLECCDFWQCNIREHDSFEEIDREFSNTYTENQDQNIIFSNNFKRGMILQFLPKKHTLDRYEKLEWYGKYIYPPHLDMTLDEYNKWVEYMVNNYQKHYPELVNNYYFDKVLYWKLESSHNFKIRRDKGWFNINLPKFTDFWDRVELYRNNEDEKQKYLNRVLKPKKTYTSANSVSSGNSTGSTNIYNFIN